jgi:hypothetical protein
MRYRSRPKPQILHTPLSLSTGAGGAAKFFPPSVTGRAAFCRLQKERSPSVDRGALLEEFPRSRCGRAALSQRTVVRSGWVWRTARQSVGAGPAALWCSGSRLERKRALGLTLGANGSVVVDIASRKNAAKSKAGIIASRKRYARQKGRGRQG